MVKKIIIFLFFLNINFALAEEISGIPKIIDGDTVHIGNKKIRLEGIDAPEIKQKCKKSFLKISSVIGINFNKNYDCGVISKKKLIQKIKNSKIRCSSSSKDRYKRYLATCFKGNINLNRWMVNQGHAVAYKKYSKRYVLDEQDAKENMRGIWQGSFLNPEKWRKLN